MASRTDGRTGSRTPDSGTSFLPQETRFGWRRDSDPVATGPLTSPNPVVQSQTTHLESETTGAILSSPTEMIGRGLSRDSQLPQQTTFAEMPISSAPAATLSHFPTRRPLQSVPQPRFTQESVAASLKSGAPAAEWTTASEDEIWWPEGANRDFSFIGPVRGSRQPANFTRTAMVAATVAAVASSSVLGGGAAGVLAQAPAGTGTGSTPQTTSKFATVKTATTTSPQVFTGEGGAPGINYTVKAGDTLYKIAEKYGVSTEELIQANNFNNPNLIFPGDHVNVPAAGGGASITITVQAGDTINKLAEHYGVDPSSIVKLASNKITNPNLIIVGQTLVIPGATGSATTASLASSSTPQKVATTTQTTNSTESEAKTQSTPAPTPQPKPQPTQAPAATQGFVWPVKGTITQKFGPTSLTLEPAYEGYAHFHQGLDIANSMYTPIHAAGDGTVIFAGWSNYGYGFCVQIDHGNGLVTLYGHMAQQPSVAVGQHVTAGQQIGVMGSTGASTGSHLHFAVQKNGVWVNPLNYLP